MNTEQENVWRTLQDKELIASWKCRFFHRWTKWRVQSMSNGLDYNKGTDNTYARRYVYEKHCVRCNLPRRKSMWLDEDNIKPNK